MVEVGIVVAFVTFFITTTVVAIMTANSEEQDWHDEIYEILDDPTGDHEGRRARMLLLFGREFRRIVNEMEAKNRGNS